jgi:hypothetical protein
MQKGQSYEQLHWLAFYRCAPGRGRGTVQVVAKARVHLQVATCMHRICSWLLEEGGEEHVGLQGLAGLGGFYRSHIGTRLHAGRKVKASSLR